MRQIHRWCVAALGSTALALGCAPNGTEEGGERGPGVIPAISGPAEKTGSRIKVGHWTSMDGAKWGVGFHDMALDMDCEWIFAEGGKHRCLPRDTSHYHPARFADPDCTRSVLTYQNTGCGAPPAYIRHRSSTLTCPTSYLLRKLGEKLAEREYYFRADDGTCSETPVTLAPGEELYEFGDKVPLSTFVAGTLKMVAAAGMLAPLVLEGEDGSRARAGYRDLKGKFDCRFVEAADGVPRCLPYTVGSLDAFSDPVCSMRAASGTKSSCQPATSFVAQNVGNACGGRISIYEAGERVDVGFHKWPTGCGTNFAYPHIDYWSPGLQLEPSQFVAATPSIVESSRRLREKVLTTPAGTAPTGALWDSQLERECSPYLLADGTYRCIGFPLIATPTRGAFADDQCAVPLAFDIGSAMTGRCIPAYAVVAEPDTCPRRYRLFAVDKAPFTGTVYRLTGGSCVAAPSTPSPKFHAIGAEVDPSELVELRPPGP